MAERRARGELAFDVVARIVGVGGLGATAYFWFSYSGTYRWLAELEISWHGAYRPLLTGTLTLLLLTAAPVGALYLVLQRLRFLAPFSPTATSRDAPSYRGTSGYVAAVVVGIVFSVAGAWQLWRGRGAGDAHQTYSVADLAERAPQARSVTLVGRLAPESALSYVERGREDVKHDFVPLVPDAWTPSDPVRFLVAYRHFGNRVTPLPGAQEEVTVTGLLDASAVPGFLLERSNLRLASPHYVLFLGEMPRGTRRGGFFLLALGALLGGGLAGSTALRYRRRSR